MTMRKASMTMHRLAAAVALRCAMAHDLDPGR